MVKASGKVLNKKVDLSWDEFKELLISHHPNCKQFDDDVIRLFGHRVCEGCLLSYGGALIGGAIIYLWGSCLDFNSSLLFIVLLFPFGFIKKITSNKLAIRIGKILMGFCIPLTLSTITKIQNIVVLTLFIMFILLLIVTYLFYRYNRMKSKLLKCSCEECRKYL